ncbi:hypothetical protein [Actinomadura madurae]|uniref:hypothetical protein n=1 Tax=Actinomadura madurae TaxID=1993 RepID=UPI0020D1FC8E|nr:hypothetical protein [Actinomadura madurae]MCQ0013224.1 hypothetical protein [Actinomadura madurae]
MTTALHPDAVLSDETARQPYVYRRRPLEEPDWRRLPGWRDVTEAEWESAQWQRAHCVKNLRQLRQVMGDLLDESFYADLERDQTERATMSMLLPPQMLNTMDSSSTEAFHADPVRRYMLPVLSDRRTDWPSHPHASRDSLHEAEMWAVEGLTHRYPTKVLAEILPTCPQYCGHCTRMDLVGNSTPPSTSTSSRSSPRTGSAPCSTTCAAPPASGTWSSPAATSPTCRGRGWSRSSTRCSTSTTSATSAWPARRSWACPSTGCRTTSAPGWSAWPPRRTAAARRSRSTPTSTPPSR